MKNRVIVLLLVINIILMGILYNLLNKDVKLLEERQVLKEMTTSEREEELDNKITELNTSATEYATYVQNCKAQIASAISEKGITTDETDSIDVVVENIKTIKTGLTQGSIKTFKGWHGVNTSTGTVNLTIDEDLDFDGQAIVCVNLPVRDDPSSNITITLNGESIPVENAYNNTIGNGEGYIYILEDVKIGDEFYVNTTGNVTPYGYTSVIMYIISN